MKSEARIFSSTEHRTGQYTSNLIGTIASNLQGLHGYDIMALELIQNANDAHAKSIIFDITDDALIVENDAEFKYCNSLCSPICPWDLRCDFHSITEIANGVKARNSDNIGRFGIGFISTYQICDHPQIISSGIQITLEPEKGTYSQSTIPNTKGTKFVLPWAKDPDSQLRVALKASAINDEDLQHVEKDISAVLHRSLFFLEHIKYAELKRDGNKICSCKLIPTEDKKQLTVNFYPSKEPEKWLVLHTNANDEKNKLIERYPQLKKDERKTGISVAFKLSPQPPEEGLFYAYLPTEQLTKLPLHINADFYPEADRKSIVLKGHKHQQDWNEMLIRISAKLVAESIIELREHLGHIYLWKLINNARNLYNEDNQGWKSFFWTLFRKNIEKKSEIAWTTQQKWAGINRSFIQPPNLTNKELDILEKLQVSVISEDLTRYHNVLLAIGAKSLTMKDFNSILTDSSLYSEGNIGKLVSELELSNKYEPLWSLIGKLHTTSRSLMEDLGSKAIVVQTDMTVSKPKDCFIPQNEDIRLSIEAHLPKFPLIHKNLENYKALKDTMRKPELENVVGHLSEIIKTPEDSHLIFGKKDKKLKKFYNLLSMLNKATYIPLLKTYEKLKSLPIFLGGQGFVTGENAVLPGDFQDPIGISTLIRKDLLNDQTRTFFYKQLNIQEQDLASYIKNFLPDFFQEPINIDNYHKLMGELSTNGKLLNDEELLDFLNTLPIIPTTDGKWHQPHETYIYKQSIADVLGDESKFWVDKDRINLSRFMLKFLDELGVPKKPTPSHLIARLKQLSNNDPTPEIVRNCERVFYSLCDQYENWEKSSPKNLDLIKTLKNNVCFPAYNNKESWFSPDELYAPYQSGAFESQASFLAFRDTKKLNNELLKFLDFRMEPETELVIDHLQYCVEKNLPISEIVYQVLNSRCKENSHQISKLKKIPCIYSRSINHYLRPNQLFWSTSHLGKYAFKVPEKLRRYDALLQTLEVKDNPTVYDIIDILKDIIEQYGDKERPLDEEDILVYKVCAQKINEEIEKNNNASLDISELKDLPCILNIENILCYPDEVAILDSPWHEKPFGEELKGHLIKPESSFRNFHLKLGVEPLSKWVVPSIDVIEGQQNDSICERLISERVDVIIRIFHTQNHQTCSKIIHYLTNIKVVTCDHLLIKFTYKLPEPELYSNAQYVSAHFEKSKNVLYIIKNDGKYRWTDVFRTILHSLLPTSQFFELPSLLVLTKALMNADSHDDALSILSEAGFPEFTEKIFSAESIEGQEISDLGTENQEESGMGNTIDSDESNEEITCKTPSKKIDENSEKHPSNSKITDDVDLSPKSSNSHPGSDHLMPKVNKPTSNRKKQRRDRLLSYVYPSDIDYPASPNTSTSDGNKHNYDVEDAARAAVCKWEEERGREAIPQSRSNPGWDIVSSDPSTGEKRLIEVKGIDGEWTELGVGLSSTQFTNAQDYGEQFWLYVVEYACNPQQTHIYPIQNPAIKVNSFFFDQNWRNIAESNEDNSRNKFRPGVKIKCIFGEGIIVDTENRGQVKLLKVKLEDGKIKRVAFNLTTMEIIGS